MPLDLNAILANHKAKTPSPDKRGKIKKFQTKTRKGKEMSVNIATRSGDKQYNPVTDPINEKATGKALHEWTLGNYEAKDKKWNEEWEALAKQYSDLKKTWKSKHSKEEYKILKKALIAKEKELYKYKCQNEGPRIKGFRLHPNSKKCRPCKHPSSFTSNDGNKSYHCRASKSAQKRRDIKVPENKKGKTAVLGPKGRWINSSKAEKYRGIKGEVINLKGMTRQQRHNLWFEHNYSVDSKGNVIKRKKQTERRRSRSKSGDRRKTRRRGPSIPSYKASSGLRKKLENLKGKNEYRSELNNLLEEKRKQRMANSKINCEIRKWKMGNNPHIIETNRDNLINMTEKACKLSENYLDLLTDIQVLKNASYEDSDKTVAVKKGGARTRRQRKRRNRTMKRY